MKVLVLSLLLVAFTSTAASVTVKPQPVGLAISQSTLDSYAGTYRISQGFALRVWRELGSLNIQPEGQPARVLVAESETSFSVVGMDAKIHFGFDASGEVDHLLMVEQGRTTRALRE